MSHLNSGIAVIGIDIGKNSFHIVGQNRRGAIVLRQKWSSWSSKPRLRIEIADVVNEHTGVERPVFAEEVMEGRGLVQVASFVLQQGWLLLPWTPALPHRHLQQPK